MILVEILPNLYLGDRDSIKYKDHLHLAAVVNCIRDLKTLGSHSEYVHNIQKNIEKYELVKMFQYLSETIIYIHKYIVKDLPVLVYCENGNQKASTVIAAYLIKIGKLTAKDAIKVIRTKNKTSFYPNIDYYNSLLMIENDI